MTFKINVSAVKYLEQRVEGIFRGSRKYSSVEFRVLFAGRVRRGEENVTGQWILSLNFLGQLKGTVYGAKSQVYSPQNFTIPQMWSRGLFLW